MEAGYGSARLSAVDRRKTLIKPERYQAPAAMLPGKEKKTLDVWVIFSKIVTFWAPGALLSSIGGLHDKSSQQAWREKVTLCFIAVVMGSTVAFLTVGFAAVLCPPDQANNPQLFMRFGDAPGHLGILGYQFNVANATNTSNVDLFNLSKTQNSLDITNYFSRDNSKIPGCQDPAIQKFAAVTMPLCTSASPCPLNTISDTTFNNYGIHNTSKKVGFDWTQVGNISHYLVIDGNVLNLKNYIAANPPNNDTMDIVIRTVLNSTHAQYGRDATRLFFGKADLKAAVNCLVNKYYAGNIDKQTIGCFTSELFLYVSLTVILSIVLCRFVMACIFDWFISHRLALEPKVKDANSSKPWVPGTSTVRKGMTMDDVGKDLFTVLLVTCYSEDEVGIRCTCESMAATSYPDDRKLLFLICDGIIVGSGNEKSTPDICVGLMELAAGSKQHNMAKVYAGYFPYQDRRVPMVVVVKCGTPEEQGKAKPGNRGKRDSQLILMNFFSRVTYNDRMCALDYDLFRKVHHLMGVTPDFFEIVLMVDADTKVYPNSLRLLINCMYNDPFIMGLCGETKIANKRDSWVTAIQVFEYYISHHLGKGFESVFGGVTCLPGCFCMYRLKARKGDDDWVPIITKPEIVHEYSQNTVETLHQKNLLLLGEDRFLTTLMLRNFPHRKMMFCPQAICKTVVPDDFWVLLSQRRRWINSTIHNLMELVLVRNLCGTFCFSMQFVVFMELIGTVVLPVAIILTYALIVAMIMKPPSDFTEAIPLMMLCMVLGLPAILILITTRKVIYIAWMFVYLLALPIWNFVLPTYAYWHFDDFSWGETRKVEGETGGDDHGKKEGSFDANKVPLKRWEDWERARLRRNKRAERQDRANQQKGPSHLTHQVYTGDDDQGNASLLASNYVNYEGDYQDAMSMHSTASGDLGPQQQYYDYSNSRYQPQDYDRYQQEQFDNMRFGNTHDLQRAPSPRLPENNY
ncbi:11625_t:CDS:2 [Racocetra persica]|uniref:11625_t:CDS:1 n=1 Tax=Racocetra persica TaxID=160502 RepID=A0ACA9N2X9_9GLOM|nr:11625_t:CDS:2 [Racocetra persica]